MTEESIYQKSLANAIEQAANSQMAVAEHLRRLAFMKAERVYEACIAKELNSQEIGTVKVIAVGYTTDKDVFKLDRYNSTDDAIKIKVVLAADVQQLIDSKRKQLTNAERKDLKEIQKMRKEADYCRKNNWYSHYSDSRCAKVEIFNRIDSDFRNRKNQLKVLDIATYCYSLTDVLNDNFLKKGLNYDNQTLVE